MRGDLETLLELVLDVVAPHGQIGAALPMPLDGARNQRNWPGQLLVPMDTIQVMRAPFRGAE